MMHANTSNGAMTYTFPLENYLTLNDDDDNLKNFKECTRRKSESAALDKINDLINLAESKLESMVSSTMIQGEMKCVYLNEPAYFDNDFDQKSYIEKLVKAKLHGMTIIKENKKPRFLEKYMNQQVESSRNNKIYPVSTDSILSQSSNENVVPGASSKDSYKNDNGILINEIETARYVDPKKGVIQKRVVKNTTIVEINSSAEKPPVKNGKSALSIQSLPSISIRSELIEQKFPLIDIYPSDENNCLTEKNNIIVVHSKHGEEIQREERIEDAVEEESNIPENDNQTGTIKRIKFVKLPNDLDENIKNIRENTTPDRPLNSHKPYMFINNTNKTLDYDIPMIPKNKKISSLKKYGLPEIQKIYNPKQSIHKKVDHLDVKYTSNRRIPYFTNSSFPISYMSKQSTSSYSKRPNYQTKSFEKTAYSNVEYIPYSKLTVGGTKGSKMHNYKTDGNSNVDSDKENTSTSVATNNDNQELHAQNDEFDTYSIDTSSSVQAEDSESEKIVKKPQKSVKNNKNTLNVKDKKKSENIDYNKSTQTDIKYTGNIVNDIKNLEDIKRVEEIEDVSESKVDESPSKAEFKISTSPKETQTNIKNTIDAATSPKKEIPENGLISVNKMTQSSEEKQSVVNVDKGIKSRRQKSNTQSENSLCDMDNEEKRLPKAIRNKRVAKSRFNVSSASEGYVDESKSESSDIQSLGEINLKIFRKKLIRILDESYSQNSNSSFSTSINSIVHLNSTLSSKKSDGEVSLHINSDKII